MLAESLKNFTHFFVAAFVSLGAKPRCDSSKSSSTGEIKPLSRLQDVAFATRTLGGKLGHSASTNSVDLFSLGQHKNERRC